MTPLLLMICRHNISFHLHFMYDIQLNFKPIRLSVIIFQLIAFILVSGFVAKADVLTFVA